MWLFFSSSRIDTGKEELTFDGTALVFVGYLLFALVGEQSDLGQSVVELAPNVLSVQVDGLTAASQVEVGVGFVARHSDVGEILTLVFVADRSCCYKVLKKRNYENECVVSQYAHEVI